VLFIHPFQFDLYVQYASCIVFHMIAKVSYLNIFNPKYIYWIHGFHKAILFFQLFFNLLMLMLALFNWPIHAFIICIMYSSANPKSLKDQYGF
jgi:hypothetical protein